MTWYVPYYTKWYLCTVTLWLYVVKNILFLLCQTKLHLKKHAEERAAASGVSLTKPVNVTSTLPEPGTKMTPDEFDKVCLRCVPNFK